MRAKILDCAPYCCSGIDIAHKPNPICTTARRMASHVLDLHHFWRRRVSCQLHGCAIPGLCRRLPGAVWSPGISGILLEPALDHVASDLHSHRSTSSSLQLVELFQSWQLLRSPSWELLKLVLVTIIAFGIGLLPYVDNWAHCECCSCAFVQCPYISSSLVAFACARAIAVGGFGFGVLSSIVFLPYITFGKWDAARKCTLLIFCIPAIVGSFIIFFSVFYTNKVSVCVCV